MSETTPTTRDPQPEGPDPDRRRNDHRSGGVGLSKLLWALLVPVLGFLGIGRVALEPGRASPPAINPLPPPNGDTVFYLGPVQRSGSVAGTNYIDQLTLAADPGRRFVLRIVNGNANGTSRVNSAAPLWNGYLVNPVISFPPPAEWVIAPLAATPIDTLKVNLKGPVGSFATISVFSVPSPDFTIYDSTFTITSGTTALHTPTFTRPANAGSTIGLYFYNGDSTGALRVNNGSVYVDYVQNGINAAIIDATQLTSGMGSAWKSRPVTTAGNHGLRITINGSVGRRLRVRITATDTTAPHLAVTAPAESTVTNLTTLPVSGTMSDQTPTGVTINGTAATVTNNTSFSGTATLSEGWNTLTVVAKDGAGLTATVLRHVRRDTQAPALTVVTPVDSLATRAALLPVSGTVIDATVVTVNTNGTPLTVTGTTFSGAVTLSYGSNTLVTTGTDAAGNATSVVRNVTWDTLPRSSR